MCRHVLQSRGLIHRPFNFPVNVPRTSGALLRTIATNSNFESKYAEKLSQRAKEESLSVDDLKMKIKQEQAEGTRRKREQLASQQVARLQNASVVDKTSEFTSVNRSLNAANARKDSSPVKSLSTILNFPKIMSSPHTAAQISSLWTAYHLSKSGRGYVCATIPLDLYTKMASAGQRYPSFVIPVPRVRPPSEEPKQEEDTAYEFYFLQWNFHECPPVPTEAEDLFGKRATSVSGENPRTSTVLFTPLQEYKSRAAYSTPYLVLTHYTDFSRTHGIVLLRGEITPTSASHGGGTDGRYMLNQEDAQLLSMSLQKFYLWDGDGEECVTEGERLLKRFHETPADFQWEDLLEHAKWNI